MGNCSGVARKTLARKTVTLDDNLFNPEVRHWIEDCVREAEQKEDPRVVVIGERGVGKSSLINSLRGLRPDAPGAARVGADEVATGEQLCGGARYRHAGLVFQDVPGCRGFQVDVSLGEDYIERFGLDTADACLFLYVSVLNAESFACAAALRSAGVSVYFVRNKVDVDCKNEIDDGNASSEEEVLAQMRQRAYSQLEAKGFHDMADEAHLFLLSAKHENAVASDPPRFDFEALKSALAGSITDEAKRSQVQQIFAKNAKALAEFRARECRNLLSYYVLASCVAGSVPVPGISQVSDLAILHRACQQFQWIFCLAEAQVAASDCAGIGTYLTLKLGLAFPVIVAVSQCATAVVDGMAWVPVLGIPFSIVVGAGVSAVGMWVALMTIIDRMEEVAEAVYAFELNGQLGEAASYQATLWGVIDDAFPEGHTGPCRSSEPLAESPDE